MSAVIDDLPLRGEARGRVVLLGGAGFIGHHLALHLAAAGRSVLVIDDLVINHLGHVSAAAPSADREWKLAMLGHRIDLLREAKVSVLVLDASDRDRLEAACSPTRDDIVVHLAGIAHADRADRDPYLTFQSGLASLAAALDVWRGGVQRFVYFSSSMVYGDFATPVADEEHPLRPKGVYGALKAAGEAMVRVHQQVFGMPCTIIRPSALYGSRCISQRVTQRFLDNVRVGLPMVVEGDGSERIDFTYVDDLVKGVALAMTAAAADGEILNLTCGNARSLLELAQVIQRAYPTATITFTPRYERRPRRGTLSIDKARRLLGYEPAVQLEEGIPRCIASERDLRQQLLDARLVPGDSRIRTGELPHPARPQTAR